jgi:diguanylate cyclase (GGDEF)-like protein
MIRTLARHLERLSKTTVAVLAIAVTVLLGLLKLITGVEIHLLLFYLVPIFLASSLVSRSFGILIAIFASLLWFVADFFGGRSYSSPWILYWNLFTRTSAFVIFAIIQSQLRAKLDELSQLAARDFLTGLPNGHAFYQLTAKEMDRAFGMEPMTLACIDVTGMQWVNDRFGYPAGDQMLCTIAHTIRQHVSRPDLVGRIAGTSFATLLPNTTSDAANLVLEQLQTSLHAERHKHSHPVTFYISAIACSKAPRTIAELMLRAESQMTRMKGGRKDSIQIARVDDLPVLN